MADVQCWAAISQKGGVGKTTVMMLIASALHLRGHRVLVVDMDPQGSATKWERKHVNGFEPFPVRVEHLYDVTLEQAKQWLIKRVSDYDFILFDTPPSLVAPELRIAATLADKLIVPFKPHSSTIDALEELRPLLASINNERKIPFETHLVVNLFNGRRPAERAILQAAPLILEKSNVLESQLKDLSAYAEAYNFRTDLFELPNAREAKAAVKDLVEEILAYGN